MNEEIVNSWNENQGFYNDEQDPHHYKLGHGTIMFLKKNLVLRVFDH